MIALVELVDEHPTECEYEVMVRLGRRIVDLHSGVLSWRDLLVVLRHAPEDSPLRRAKVECGHSPAEHLSLFLLHSTQVGNWQRAHGKKRDYPKLPVCLDQSVSTEKIGSAPMPLEEAAGWLGWALPGLNAA